MENEQKVRDLETKLDEALARVHRIEGFLTQAIGEPDVEQARRQVDRAAWLDVRHAEYDTQKLVGTDVVSRIETRRKEHELFERQSRDEHQQRSMFAAKELSMAVEYHQARMQTEAMRQNAAQAEADYWRSKIGG